MKIATKNSSSAFAGSGRINEDPDFGLELSSLEIRHQQLSEEYQQLRRIAAERAQNIIDRFELTAEDVTLHERRSAFHSAPNKVTPKYRGPNGELLERSWKAPGVASKRHQKTGQPEKISSLKEADGTGS